MLPQRIREEAHPSGLSSYVIGSLLVAFIVGLCLWTFVVHWVVVVPQLLQLGLLPAILITGFHHFLHCSLLLSLYKAVVTDPGYITTPAACRSSERDTFQQDFCTKCSSQRPQRAHHCSTCHRCVRKMDHHCLFVNNCVGQGNYKYFLLLLFYTIVGGAYNAFCDYMCIMWTDGSLDEFSRNMALANAVAICMISLILLPLFMIHMYLISRDTTTLEALKGETGKYSTGHTLRNFKKVLGNVCWLWFSPLHPSSTIESVDICSS
uniref:Palmitoyltransferase n=1 Tax=Hanusia phi TaxID=3032 RepID=A0A7S0E0U6_9CRYP|mmetsp:Transcript_14212/g.32726  ORF Transcript_14212/g.32726 Transcript_14212/m.32726 type:complete len:264 (+) Transcript_14212:46-837(+)